MDKLFITGIGTGVGKTVTAACVTQALQADYWKPVQTGLLEGTDRDTVRSLVSNDFTVCHPELYRLKEPASPHLAARMEDVKIELRPIIDQAKVYQPVLRPLVIEGAGGIMVPLNEDQFMLDMVLEIQAQVIIVAQLYLGSINHALLTAELLRQKGAPVLGWIFNGPEHSNAADIVRWSGYPLLGHIPFTAKLDKAFVKAQKFNFR
ncbi:dethiobiotin synthetase [Chitinophaga costaii]|uniref:ATP-dependent dethiobiotin synthetase BioD n=1 Tax=Chitinophaga costaii TaxID=1335309 RepID=A0A1C4G361_9BACT|nr:dethiobiotin synthase [Chitinophaga costaii]PUZ20971.1 dethiobiotin synthase [Chitinophaga costaii]SCC62638.1 dethiobiotin synthetase [Chitinophaga costaii]